jgi:hypothetical protein
MSVDAPPVVAGPASQCRSIDDVIAKMESVGERFETEHGPHDGVLCFNRLYLEVTMAVKRAVKDAGYFSNPELISRLDVIFAQLYFDAVDALDRAKRHRAWGWRVLFEARDRPDVFPIQFAAAGMNAHINHDLPIALLELWRSGSGRPARNGAAYADYLRINEILAEVEHAAKRELEPSLLHTIEELDHEHLGRLDDKLALWAVDEARANAWDTAARLWDVRGLPLVRRAWLSLVGAGVGALGKILLEPV